MINYSSIKLREAVDEVMLRLGQQQTAINLDWATVATFVNRARMEILSRTLPYKDWAYLLRNVPVAHGEPLPDVTIGGVTIALTLVFVSPVRVLLREDTAATDVEYREARYVDVREFCSLCEWQTRQRWNPATVQSPVWTYWGAKNPTAPAPKDDNLYFYAAPNADVAGGYMNWQTGTAPAGYTYYQNSMRGVMDCYTGYPDTFDPQAVMSVPYEFENLMIVFATMRSLARIGQTSRLVEMQKKSMSDQQKLRQMYQLSRQMSKQNLESLVDMPRGYSREREGQ